MSYRPNNPALFFYILLTYAFPAVAIYLTKYESTQYIYPEVGFLGCIYAIFLFGITMVFSFVPERSIPKAPPPIFAFIKKYYVRLVVVLLLLVVLGVYGYVLGYTRWRYTGEPLSSSLSYIKLIFVCSPNFLEILLFVLIFFYSPIQIFRRNLLIFLTALCLGLMATGIGPAVTLLIAFFAFCSPNKFDSILFNSETSNSLRIESISTWRLFFFFCGVAISMGIAYVFGDSIKTGTTPSAVIDDLFLNGIGHFLYYLLERLSVNWYSLVASLHYFIDLDMGGQFYNLLSPILNFQFRIDAITGGAFEQVRPDDGSLARINYNLININPANVREGTTPGLLPSFILAFPPLLSPFFLTAYLIFYDSIQKQIRRRIKGNPTWIGEIIILYFTSIFFASPIDFLQIFDPMFLSLCAWIYLAYSRRSR